MKKYMVVERFKPGCFNKVYDRFNEKGRMLPEGLHYLNSWVNEKESICFQLMETNDESLFKLWIDKWADYTDFEVFPID
ncbi:hypothetical protein GCM10009122_58980 [Fulvivirga kasyanovii]|uniref:DUF3303 domain-containing protein n=1 Tax=Fulvivirga kasyanovii TaxID=396812 RepID=A0ABW9RVB3_9BACT|nr:DUF3303 family protein [Fulvivirga kasyanovii]MTI27991.1 DUF3303 domain-containing protein [Fulvivirga kasyanovii]